MALISSTIPNMINGVSQQPPALRLASQAESVINCLSSPVEGLTKRPPFNHLAKLISGSAGTGKPFVEIVDRDGTIQYLIMIRDGAIDVFNLDGTSQTITTPNGTDYLDITNTAEPTDKFRVASVADYTFIVNREKVVTMDHAGTYTQSGTAITVNSNAHGLTSGVKIQIDFETGSSVDGTYVVTVVNANQFTLVGASASTSGNCRFNELSPDVSAKGIVFIKAADYSTTYEIKIKSANGSSTLATASFTTAAVGGAVPNSGTIATDLRNDLASALPSGWIFTVDQYIIRIEKQDGTDFVLESSDTKAGTYTKAIKGAIDTISDLPTLCEDGFVIKVQGSKTTRLDDYYVRFETSNGTGFGFGIWRETVGPLEPYKFNKSTMPYVLVRDAATGNFEFKQFDWSPRIAGDLATAPTPTFVGTTINNINSFRNRLIFLADENVIMSAADSYDRFFPETVQTIVDSDPIDLVTGGTEIHFLTSSLAFANTLLLFSRHGQFRLDAGASTIGGALTPKTATITAMTTYETEPSVDPIAAGRTVYFSVPKGEFSGLRDFYLQDVTASVPVSEEVSSAVPRYIPKNITTLISSASEETIVAISKDEPKRIYFYKFFYEEDSKLQSSWSFWEVKGAKTMLGASIVDSDVYFVIQYSDGVYLEKCSLRPESTDEGSELEILLDRKIDETKCHINVINQGGAGVQSVISLPYPTATAGIQVVVGRDVAGNTIQHGEVKVPSAETLTGATQSGFSGNGTMTVLGDLTNAKFFIGEKYDMTYEFSTPYLKEQPTGGGVAVVAGPRLQIRTWTFVFDDTSAFKIKVTPRGRDPFTYPYNGFIVGQNPPALGQAPFLAGTFRVPVMAHNNDTKVEILSDSPLPCRIQSSEWEGWLHTRARRL
nr:putative tail tubular protein B [uncultured Mediterranean phage uvMED]